MERILGRHREILFAAMRFVVGALFACHGAQKTLGMFGGKMLTEQPPLMQLGGVIELVGGVLIAVGLFTSVAAFVCSGMMAVAYFKVHASGGFWPIVNKGELAVVYCFVFLFLAAHGSGALSLDRLMRRR